LQEYIKININFLQILRGNKATAAFIRVAALASMKQFPDGFTLKQSRKSETASKKRSKQTPP